MPVIDIPAGLSDEQKRKYISDLGYDPNGMRAPVEADFAAPAENVQQAQQQTPLKTAYEFAKQSVVPTIGGLGGAALGGAITPAIVGSAAGPLGTAAGLGIGLAGAIGGSMLANKAQDVVAPKILGQDVWQNRLNMLAEGQKENPLSAFAGSFAPQALALRPSLDPVRSLIAAGGLQGLKNLPKVASNLTPASMDALKQATIGAGIGAAQEGYEQVQADKFDPAKLAIATAFGAALNKPWGAGKLLFPAPVTPNQKALTENIVEGQKWEAAQPKIGDAIEVPASPENVNLVDKELARRRLAAMSKSSIAHDVAEQKVEIAKLKEAQRQQAIEAEAARVRAIGNAKFTYGLSQKYTANPELQSLYLSVLNQPKPSFKAEQPLALPASTIEKAQLKLPYYPEKGYMLEKPPIEVGKPQPRKVYEMQDKKLLQAEAERQVIAKQVAEQKAANEAMLGGKTQSIEEGSIPTIPEGFNSFEAKEVNQIMRELASGVSAKVLKTRHDGVLVQRAYEQLYGRSMYAAPVENAKQETIKPVAERLAPDELQFLDELHTARAPGAKILSDPTLPAPGKTDLTTDTISLNPKTFDRTTPLHEIAHIFSQELKGNSKRIYDNMLRLFAKSDRSGRTVNMEKLAELHPGVSPEILNQIAAEEHLVRSMEDPTYAKQFAGMGEIRKLWEMFRIASKLNKGLDVTPEEASKYATWRMIAQRAKELPANSNLPVVKMNQVPLNKEEKIPEYVSPLKPFEGYGETRKTQEIEFKDDKWDEGDSGNVNVKFSAPLENENFKKWFGDSKVIDEEGKPLVVYHGTQKAGFNSFYPQQHFGTAEAANNILVEKGKYRTKLLKEGRNIEDTFDFGKNDAIYPTYLSIKKPKFVSDQGNEMAWQKEIQKAKAEGYDGLIYKNSEEGGVSFLPFDSAQIKSATGNTGEYSPNNSDIRYAAPLASAVEQVKQKYPEIGKAADTFYERFNFLRGQYTEKMLRPIQEKLNILERNIKLDSSELQRVMQYMSEMYKTGASTIKLNPVEQEMRNNISAVMGQIRADHNARPGLLKGEEAKIVNPDYIPDTPSGKVLSDLAKDQATYEMRKKEFLDFYTDVKKISKEEAEDKWKNFVQGYGKLQQTTASQFGPIDKAAGMELPPSWVEKNPFVRLSHYTERVARRFAYYDAFESNKAAQAELLDSGANLDPNFQAIRRDIEGVKPVQENIRSGVLNVVRAGMLGPLTGIKDLASAHFLGWQYQTPTQVLPALVKGWTDFRTNFKRTFENGINRSDFSSIEDGIESRSIATVLNKTRNIINKVQGRDALEQMSRGFTFAQGRFLAADNLTRALTGRGGKQTESFLENFAKAEVTKAKDRKFFTPEELDRIASRYTESVQGKYDYRSLPVIAKEGTLAPFLALARWNIDKLNNFRTDVIGPLRKGNPTPFLMATMAGIIGGAAVEKLVQEITGRKGNAPTLDEIEYAEGSEKMDALLYKAAILASYSGYAGMLGDLVKSLQDMRWKNKPQGFTNPLINSIQDNYTIFQNIVDAMQNGDPISAVDAMSEIAGKNFQAYRIIAGLTSTEKQQKIDEANKLRDVKTWKNLSGLPVSRATDVPNPFLNSVEKKFKKQTDPLLAKKMLREEVIPLLRAKASDPIDLKRRMAGLKSNAIQTFPAPSSNPIQARKYFQFLETTQGKNAAQERLKDYRYRSALNRARVS